MASVPERVDFSPNARVYDQRHGAVISDRLTESLASCLIPGSRIIDIGAGTGRVSVPLAGLGFRVVALDPAVPMLQAMRQKSGPGMVPCVAAEGARLPFRRSSLDAVVLARLLYLVPDWKNLLSETKDVLRPGGKLFHEWGNGSADEAWVQVREKARSLFQNAGIENPFHPGARSEAEIEHFLRDLGLLHTKRIDAGAGPAITLADFLSKIESGELSYIWNIPKEVQDSCLPQLKRWCESRFDLDLPAPMPAELHWTVYENPA
jgi:SAM-dependent methyltransferase